MNKPLGHQLLYPYVGHVAFVNYRRYGVLIGKNDSNGGKGQMNSVLLERCIWEGAVASDQDAYGAVISAQNAEFVTMIQPYFSPNRVKPLTSEGFERYHKHHIYFPHYVGRAGLTVLNMLSTRASGHAIKNPSQLNVLGWRSEDRLLVDWGFPVRTGVSFLTSIAQRNASDPLEQIQWEGNDETIIFNGKGFPLTISSSALYGSVIARDWNAHLISLQNVHFQEVFDLQGLNRYGRGRLKVRVKSGSGDDAFKPYQRCPKSVTTCAYGGVNHFPGQVRWSVLDLRDRGNDVWDISPSRVLRTPKNPIRISRLEGDGLFQGQEIVLLCSRQTTFAFTDPDTNLYGLPYDVTLNTGQMVTCLFDGWRWWTSIRPGTGLPS